MTQPSVVACLALGRVGWQGAKIMGSIGQGSSWPATDRLVADIGRMSLWGGGKASGSAAAGGSRWGGNDGGSWEEKNWDAVQKQEQLKQEVLVKASQNSERIRQMVRETNQTTEVAKETLTTLDQQSGE